MPTRNLIPPHIAHQSIPLYAIPASDTSYDSLSLSVYRGADLLDNNETIDYRVLARIEYPSTSLWGFELLNEEASPCTITGFTVSGDISLFASEFEVGDVLGVSEGREFWIESRKEVPSGLRDLEGQFIVLSTYPEQTGTEEHVITIQYHTKRIKEGVILSQPPQDRMGKLAPYVYTDDFTKDLNRVDTESKRGSPRTPGSFDRKKRRKP